MRRIMFVALLLVAAANATAQETARRPDAYFLEHSRIFYRLPPDDLAFEGQIAPHLFFHRSDVFGDGDVFDQPVWTWAASFTPLLRLRMLSTESHPVRTPSYMPRPFLDWQLFRASAVDTTWDDRRYADVPVRLWGITFTPWAHHSNGQDGCLFEHQIRGPVTGECIGTLPSDSIPVTNKVDGSFSTNFIRIRAGYSWFAAPDTVGGPLQLNRRCTYEFGVEYHPIGYLMGALSEDQAEYYSQWQVTLGVEWSAPWKGQWIVGADARWLNDPAPGVDNWAYDAEVSWLPDFLSGWGGFVRYYSGMDYYNLGFMEAISYLQFGFTWDLGAVPRILFPERRNPMVDTAPPYRRNALLDRTLPALFDGVCRRLHGIS
jgi:hypothetical protein